jgi:hypothetical protein
MLCIRCKTETNSHTTSYFNTDDICMPCKTIETKHPLYDHARDSELAEVKKGNYKYPGLFAGKKWTEIEKMTEKI